MIISNPKELEEVLKLISDLTETYNEVIALIPENSETYADLLKAMTSLGAINALDKVALKLSKVQVISESPEKIVILDFTKNTVYALDYDSNLYHNVEDFFISEGVLEADLSVNNCEYMIIPTKDLSFKFTL